MQTRIHRNSRCVPWWLCFLLAIMIVVNMVPYLSRNASLAIQFAVLILIPISMRMVFRSLDSWEKNTILFILLYIVLEALYKVVGVSTAGVDFYFSTIKFFWLYIIYRPLRNRLDRKQKLFLILVTLGCYVYTVFTNITYANTYDHYISMYSRVSDSNAANTAYATCAMLLSGLFVIVAMREKRVFIRIASILLAILGFYYLIFIAERGTTFILSFLMLALLFFYKGNSNNSRAVLIIVLGVVFVVAFYSGLLTNFLIAIRNLLPDRLAARMNAIINMVNGAALSEAGSTMTSRYALIMRSVETFFGSPIVFLFGAGDLRHNNLIIGNHSQWIDVFPRYGLAGGILLINIIRRIYRDSNFDFEQDPHLYREYRVIFWMFLVRGLLGNVFAPSIGTVLFITVPAVLSLLMEETPEIVEE